MLKCVELWAAAVTRPPSHSSPFLCPSSLPKGFWYLTLYFRPSCAAAVFSKSIYHHGDGGCELHSGPCYSLSSTVDTFPQAGVLSDKSLVATKKTGSLETGPTLHDQNKWEEKKKPNKNLSCDVMGGMEMSNVRCSQDLCCSVPATLFFGKCCNPQSHKHEMGERSDASWPSDWENKATVNPLLNGFYIWVAKKKKKNKKPCASSSRHFLHTESQMAFVSARLWLRYFKVLFSGVLCWGNEMNTECVCCWGRSTTPSESSLTSTHTLMHSTATFLISHLKNNVGTSHVSSRPGQGTTHFLCFTDCSCVVLIKKTTKQKKTT